MTVDQLVKLNNEKRKLLTEENETYYTDLLVYIRMNWRLSERQTEEVMLEMLDHLLDAQNEGKSAKDVFGDDPLSFADSVIEEIVAEKPRNIVTFIIKLIVLLLGWVLVIRGVLLLILSNLTVVDNEINVLQVAVAAIGLTLFVIVNVSSIFLTVKKDLFIFPKNKKTNFKAMNRVGLTAGLSMFVLLLAIYFTPEVGPVIYFSPLASLITGSLLLSVHFILKKVPEK